MPVRLYGMSISHPANAARLMLDRKGIEYELVELSPGEQAVRIRLAGFCGGTVPALRIDGRRVLGSRAISRALDEIRPDPPLFPRDPERRRAVEAAEEWGERILQPVPRRLVRWALRHDVAARTAFLGMAGIPLPGLTARLIGPATVYYARREDAGRTEQVLADWSALPGHLDHVDGLIAAGTIGGPEPNAADFQIGTTLRVMLASADYAPLLEGRPAAELARRVWPDFGREMPPLIRLVESRS